MPLRSVRCKWRFEDEREVPASECVACAMTGDNPCGYPLPFIRQMTRDRNPDEVRCSSTMFDGCAREQGLKVRVGYSVDPDRVYTRAFGSISHLGAEVMLKDGTEDTYLSEKRYKRELLLPDGRTALVTAQVDARYLTPEGLIIHDYKLTDSLSDSAITRKVEHYVPQFSIQRWILAGMGIETVKVNLYFLSHKKRRVVNLYPHGEPDIPSSYLMTLDETENYLKERAPLLLDALEDGPLPEPIKDKNEFWRCWYCDVQEQCLQAAGGSIPAIKKT